MFRFAVACLAVAQLALAPAASAAISDDLVFCSKLKNGAERLACYDAAARLEKSGSTTTAAPLIAKSVEPKGTRPARKWDGVFVGIGAAALGVRSGSNGILTSNPGGDPNVTVGGETVSSISSSAKGSGAGLGLRGGYTAQLSPLVFGVQGDLLLPAVRADQGFLVGRCDNPACVSSWKFGGEGSLAANWIVSATARVGWLTPDNNNLLYALGGVSYGDFSANVVSGISISSFAIGAPYRFSFPRSAFAATGWTAGAGWERRITDGWSLYAEYRFSRFENFDLQHTFSYAPCVIGLTCTAVSQMNGSLDLHSVQLGVNRTFGLD